MHTVAGLYAVLVGVGLTSAMVLYEPAFAIVVAWFDPTCRAKALLAVTVVAGFASSVFLPLTGLLVDRYGWRTALLAPAVLHGVATVPLHALVMRRSPTHPQPMSSGAATGGRDQTVCAAVRDARFWSLAVAFVAHSTAISALTVHLVAYLISRGHPAAFAASAVTG